VLVHGVPCQESISSTFYTQIFSTKVLQAAFLYLSFGLVIFWRKHIGTKVSCKMFMKLTPDCKVAIWHKYHKINPLYVKCTSFHPNLAEPIPLLELSFANTSSFVLLPRANVNCAKLKATIFLVEH